MQSVAHRLNEVKAKDIPEKKHIPDMLALPSKSAMKTPKDKKRKSSKKEDKSRNVLQSHSRTPPTEPEQDISTVSIQIFSPGKQVPEPKKVTFGFN